MPLYRPSELRAYLNNIQASPKKGLSQHFLIDGNIIQKMISIGEVTPNDVILEIGPGVGALTEALLTNQTEVIAVEKDANMVKALGDQCKSHSNLHLYHDDILKFPFAKVLGKSLKKNQKSKVIANLPYSITSPILTLLAPNHHLFSKIVVMVQQEVGKRITACAGTSEYGSLTLFLNFYAKVTYGFTVSKHCFYPEPSVSSAVIVLDLKCPPKDVDPIAFFTLTRSAFGKRRKMLRGSLREFAPPKKIEMLLEKIGKKITARPEELSLNEWIQLYFLLAPQSTNDYKSTPDQ